MLVSYDTHKRQLGGDTPCHYDPLNQLKKVEYPGCTEEMFYDKAGNRTRRIAQGVEELYQYDPRNRLMALTKGGEYYLHALFYDPVITRFTQEDTYRGDGLMRFLNHMDMSTAPTITLETNRGLWHRSRGWILPHTEMTRRQGRYNRIIINSSVPDLQSQLTEGAGDRLSVGIDLLLMNGLK